MLNEVLRRGGAALLALVVLLAAAAPRPLPGALAPLTSAAARFGPLVVAVIAVTLGLRAARSRSRRLLGLLVIAGALAGAVYGLGFDVARLPAAMVSYAAIGMVVGLFWRGGSEDGSRWLTALVAVALLAVADETVQWWVPGRSGGALELGHALAGAAAGIGFVALVLRSAEVPFGLGRSGWTTSLRALALLLPFVALFLQLAHVGHRLAAPSVNATFHSKHEAAALAEIDRTWRPLAEPTALADRLLTGADRYLEEARWHATRARELAAAGGPAEAWQSRGVLHGHYPAAAAHLGVPDATTEEADVVEEARQVARDLGPPWLLTGLDSLTLWLACAALCSGLLLAAEATSFGRAGA